ncbi:hypothetical protein J2W97_004259 [Paenibacillus jamilae]|uniref:hypothetical protein n=1 Tax=Paenibacillus TaxID=44249 RepID=UPI0011B20A69|nr:MULTISPECIES: hypothetical protein [Paenibacillus]KAF6625489.1 hypothetical protein HFE01_24605 [Paenibacillus sp. EKM10P]MDP9678229.1 hypothetical protein [Paenibacillus jamilae]
MKDNKEHRSTQEKRCFRLLCFIMLAVDEPPEDGLWFNNGFGIGFGGWTRDVPPIDVRLAVGFRLASRKSAVSPDSAPELPLSKPMFKGY